MERLWCLVTCCVLLVVTVSANEDAQLRSELRAIQSQVAALLERRNEDAKILQSEANKNSEVSALRDEVDSLRQEVDSLRGNRQKNDHLTVQWLSSAVSELRAELSEMAAAHNASADLQRTQQTETELRALRGDVAAVRADIDALRAGVARAQAAAEAASSEARAAASNAQQARASCRDARSNVEMARADWAADLKLIGKKTQSVKFHPKLERESWKDNEVTSDRHYRHQRPLRQQVAKLEAAEHELEAMHSRFEHRLRRLEKLAEAAEDAQMGSRIAALEAMTGKALMNATRGQTGVDKLRRSLLELLESVEALEEKVDRSLPDLQKEISKVEFSAARLTSSVALIKEDQDNQRATVKAVAGGLESLQEKLEARASLLKAQMMNLTQLSNGSVVGIYERDDTQDARLDALEVHVQVTGNSTGAPGTDVIHVVQELTVVQQEYEKIISRLPRDCGSVDDSGGLHLLNPDGVGRPLMAWCDHGWTVVQRRVDGSQDFNRKWKEYADGFGSPAGEFWMGNDALHRLTADNCSSLRVDLRDIYGKAWTAEYEEFSVGPAEDGYRLHVGGYSGNASDAFEYQNGMRFSAIDRDNDISGTNCAANYEGGWWFSHCQHVNLNGRYNLGLTWFVQGRNEWIAVAWSEIRVRRAPTCRPAPAV